MEMNVEQSIPAPPQRVWEALNDTEILRASIPGCESLEAASDTAFSAQVVTKIGPVKAKFKFHVTLTDLDPPHSYTINAEGQGGAAGFANGSAHVTLKPDGSGTLLAYQAKARVGGKLAQLGARLIDGTARKLAEEFFTNFSDIVASTGTAAEPAPDQAPGSGSTAWGMPVWAWITLGVLVAFGIVIILV